MAQGREADRWREDGGVGVLKLLSLRDITDRIALTNGHLSGGLTDPASDQEVNQPASLQPAWADILVCIHACVLGAENKHVHELIIKGNRFTDMKACTTRKRGMIDCLGIIVGFIL